MPIAAALILAWPSIIRLRETRAVDAIDAARREAGPGCEIMVANGIADAACMVRMIPAEIVTGADPNDEVTAFAARAAATKDPVILIVDRIIGDGSRFALNGGALLDLPQLDAFHPEPGGIRVFSVEGHASALIANVASRPATRN